MNYDSINQTNDERSLRTRDVLWLVFYGVLIGAILTVVTIQWSSASDDRGVQERSGGISEHTNGDWVKKLNEESLSILNAAFR